MTHKYAILMETSGDDCESWYYFLKYEGNEDELKNIKTQFDTIDHNVLIDSVNIYDIEVDKLVSEQTAKEMCLLELNSVAYHRKFDGILKKVDFVFKDKDKDSHRLFKIHDVLRDGSIGDFIDSEDIPPEHVKSDSDDESTIESDDDDIDVTKLPECLKDLKMKNIKFK